MKKLIVGNLKMNILSPAERERYFKSFNNELGRKSFKKVEIIICPPFIHLESFASNLGSKTVHPVKSAEGGAKQFNMVKIGAQDMHWEDRGSYTGGISPTMIKNTGAEYVIIGHSERRKYFGETNEIVNLKIKSALKNRLTPIVCIGETKEEKEMDITMDIIIQQIREGLCDITRTQMDKIIFAYEPVWAVGSDVVPSSDEIMGARLLIKKILTEKYGHKYIEKVKILYGGSVNYRIIKQVCIEPEMSGVLVGGESLVPHDFIKIAQEIDSNS
ncbi:triosephosphate isomerase [bacterium BMS3Abin15]|nr:triosephosphate isomerase [bacterium BMS3Abin15]